MKVGELQKILKDFEKKRGWDLVLPQDTVVHLTEEVGEVARILRYGNEVNAKKLGEELSDVVVFVVKLANYYDIDLESAISEKLQENEKRYPVKKSRKLLKDYLEKRKKKILEFEREFMEVIK